MSKPLINILIPAGLLIFVLLISLFSIKEDSLTMDELAHLPAGYSYLTQRDMRLNPEHPPLIKDLAALPLIFMKGINFPSQIKSWKEDVNGQWDFGNYFLFKAGNPADKMIFASRLPMILILVMLGFYVFIFAKEFFGLKTALLSLFLFSFSPTFLAHGRLVTTDVGAAAAVLIATYYFLKALKEPSKKNVILSGLSFGLAQLLKFNAIFLVPFFGFLTLLGAVLRTKSFKREGVKKLAFYSFVLILVFAIGGALIWPVYQYHLLDYPAERQARDIEFILSSHPVGFLGPFFAKLAHNKILRPFVQYLFGLAMVFQRGVGGNTTYFLGEVSGAGWRTYFPVVYLVKEPLAFHALTLIAILGAAWSIKKPFWQETLKRMKGWLDSHFTEFSLLFFIFLYWTVTLAGNLNIGVRHLLPVFPLTILLVSKVIVGLLKPPFLKAKCLLFGALLLWQAISVISIYPHFIVYFNELAGGPDKGYLIAADSNLDWGQDLKRLKKWTEENKIDKIYISYFGGTDLGYYFGEKYQAWWGGRNPNEIERPAYLAISATLLQAGRGKPAPGFDQPTDYYFWLDKEELVTKIGYSIFVYYLD